MTSKVSAWKLKVVHTIFPLPKSILLWLQLSWKPEICTLNSRQILERPKCHSKKPQNCFRELFKNLYRNRRFKSSSQVWNVVITRSTKVSDHILKDLSNWNASREKASITFIWQSLQSYPPNNPLTCTSHMLPLYA